MPALSLTAFREIPWNAPYYEQLGFRVLREEELTPGLIRIRELEARHGLEPDLRVCMRRDLRPLLEPSRKMAQNRHSLVQVSSIR